MYWRHLTASEKLMRGTVYEQFLCAKRKNSEVIIMALHSQITIKPKRSPHTMDDAKVRRLATVVRDSNDAIIISDFEGRITAWNRGAE